jgi:hypothetical protein
MDGRNEEVEKLVRVLQEYHIIVGDEDERESLSAPLGPESVSKQLPERMLRIEVGERANENRLVDAVKWAYDKVKRNGLLQVVFSGAGLARHWNVVRATLQRTYTDTCRSYESDNNVLTLATVRADVLDLPEDLRDSIAAHDILLVADYPWDNGTESETAAMSQRDVRIREIVKRGCNVRLSTTVTAGNVGRMLEMAHHHAELTNGSGFDFPAVSVCDKEGRYRPASLLPAPDLYVQGLLSIYEAQIVAIDSFSPLDELYSRITRLRGFQMPALPLVATFYFSPIGAMYPDESLKDVGGLELSVPDNVLKSAYSGSVEDLKQKYTHPRISCANCAYRWLCGGMKYDVASLISSDEVPPYVLDYLTATCCTGRLTLLTSMIARIVVEEKSTTDALAAAVTRG